MKLIFAKRFCIGDTELNKEDLPKHVKDKLRLAERGDIFSCFYIANYFVENDFLDPESKISNKYFHEVARKLKSASYRMESIQLLDYKRFKSSKVIFSKSGATILIGNNGAGKSTLLDALAKNLKFIYDNIRRRNNNNYVFNESEIRIDSESRYSKISCDIKVSGEDIFSCSLVSNQENIPRKINSELEQFKSLASMLQESDRIYDGDFSYPLFAYYPVERSITSKREELAKKQEKSSSSRRPKLSKVDGLTNSFDGSSNFEAFFDWFKRIDDILNEEKAQNSISADDLMKMLESLQDNESVDSLMEKLSREHEKDNKNESVFFSRQIQYVKKAIKTFLVDIEDIGVTRTPHLDIFVSKMGRKISVFSLSQGEKTLLALVADIARRLVLLNPTAEYSDPLSGHGIVLIDEVDLHLHPQWQQSIIQDLENTFPNIQFIVSTHSPLVLTTVKSKQIRRIDVNYSGDVEISTPSINPYGKVSSDGLAIMDTSEKPRLRNNLFELLNSYEELVKSGGENSAKGISLRKQIDSLGYSIDESQLELWRFIAINQEFIKKQ